jgi:hypothetical protein
MASRPDPTPDLSFAELVEVLSRLAWNRLSFALVRVELVLRLGHEPSLQEIWVEYARRHPDAVRGARALIALGLVVCANAEKPTSTADPPGCEAPLEAMELVPRWWHRLESIRLSLGG